jgi:hypothetical protein
MESTWNLYKSARDNVLKPSEDEEYILWPDILYENHCTVCKRKENIANIYYKNANWVQKNKLNRKHQLDVLTQNELNASPN